jgi:hypothetical protein
MITWTLELYDVCTVILKLRMYKKNYKLHVIEESYE